MENEKTESCALVPVEEVEAELVFNPNPDKSLVGYGSRKIIRESLKNHLRNVYVCLDYDAVEPENELRLSKRDSNILSIVNLLVDDIYTKKELAEKTRLTETQVGYALSLLVKLELVEMLRSEKTCYYKISEDE